jgi:hypothetical protein
MEAEWASATQFRIESFAWAPSQQFASGSPATRQRLIE